MLAECAPVNEKRPASRHLEFTAIEPEWAGDAEEVRFRDGLEQEEARGEGIRPVDWDRALSAASGDAADVFLAVERVVVGPRAGRRRAADRLVVVEG